MACAASGIRGSVWASAILSGASIANGLGVRSLGRGAACGKRALRAASPASSVLVSAASSICSPAIRVSEPVYAPQQADGAGHDRVEYRLDIRLRAADDAQDVAGRGLLSSAVVSSRLLACSSVNRRTFSIAMTAWSAKVCSSAISSSVNPPGSRRVTAIAPTASPCRSIGTTSRLR